MADNARFHNKLHRKNHHSIPTPGYPDSGTDPIASREEPFEGDFVVNASVSAHNNLYVDNNATILGNLSVYGDFTYFETIVSVTSALSVVNSGTGPALNVIQNGPQPIARFIDGDASPLSGRYALFINDKGESVFGWDSVGPVGLLSSFQLGIVNNQDKVSEGAFLIETFNSFNNDGPSVRGLRSAGTSLAPAGVSADDILMGMRGWGMLDNGERPAQVAPVTINLHAAEKYTQTNQGSYITFTTTPTGGFTGNSRQERVRITSHGYVGVNITDPQQTLTVSGTISSSNGLSARNAYFYQKVGIATPDPSDIRQTLTVTGTISSSNGLSARNAYFVKRAAVGIIDQHEENMATLTVRGSVSASEGLSAYSGNYWGYLSAAQLRAYYTDSNHVTANYIFGYENESIFTDGINLEGNGNGTLTVNYTNGLYVSSAPVHFPLAKGAGTGLIFARDASANLYRNAPSTLRTDGSLLVNTNLSAFGNTTLGDADTDTTTVRGTVRIADSDTDAIIFGSGDATYDTNLYRSAANTLKTDDSLIVDTNLTVNGNTTLGNENTDTTIIRGTVKIADSNTNAIVFGSGNATYDTNLYRSAANTLKTDGSLIVDTNLNVNGNTTLGNANTDTTTINGNVVLVTSNTQTFTTEVTANGNFLIININGTNKAIRLWDY